MADENKKKRGRPKTFDDEGTTERAMQAYWDRGLDGVSLNEIVRQAGVSKPSVYRHFGGEDGLQHAALERYDELYGHLARTALQSGDTLGADLAAWFAAHVETERNPDCPLGCLIIKANQSADALGEQSGECLANINAKNREALLQRLESARSVGELRGGLEVEIAATFLMGQIAAIRALPSTDTSDQVLHGVIEIAIQAVIA